MPLQLSRPCFDSLCMERMDFLHATDKRPGITTRIIMKSNSVSVVILSNWQNHFNKTDGVSEGDMHDTEPNPKLKV